MGLTHRLCYSCVKWQIAHLRTGGGALSLTGACIIAGGTVWLVVRLAGVLVAALGSWPVSCEGAAIGAMLTASELVEGLGCVSTSYVVVADLPRFVSTAFCNSCNLSDFLLRGGIFPAT